MSAAYNTVFFPQEAEFHWGKKMEGYILGSFYWGYLIFQIPGGRIAEK